MKLNGRKSLDEIGQRDSKKNQTFLALNDICFFFNLLVFNSRAYIVTKYMFNPNLGGESGGSFNPLVGFPLITQNR